LSDAKPESVAAPVAAPVTAPAEPKPAEVKAPEPPAAVTPPTPPTYEAFKLPEGATLDKGRMGEFTTMLGEFETANKTDHAAMQAFGQRALDFHIQEVTRMLEGQQAAWTQMRDEWKGKFLADADMGGAHKAATMGRCGAMIEQYGGTAEQQTELRQVFAMTGAGDHPAVIRLINNMGKVLSEGTPVPAQNSKGAPQGSRASRRYAGTMNGAN
jgi:hypothetical protein